MNNDKLADNILGILVASFIITLFLGYFINIYDIFLELHSAITGVFILRVVGIFMFPIGIIMGLFV